MTARRYEISLRVLKNISRVMMNDLTFISWVIKGAHCIALNKIDFNPICGMGNQQVKCEGKPQATQPYLRSAGRKNPLVMACLYNFHVAVNCCQTKCCWGHVRGEHINKALKLA